MGDAADDAAAMCEEQYFEYLAEKACVSKLSDNELVGQVESHFADKDEPMSTWEALDEEQSKMAVGISVWYRDKGFLTVRQRNALISIVAMLWTE
jgi:hypothetical protein